MKKKLLLVSLMIAALICLFAVSLSATKIDQSTVVELSGSFTDPNGNAVTTASLYDSDGDALIWYLNTDGALVSAKIASMVTVDENGVISFIDQSVFYNKASKNSTVVVNLRDNVKVSGTDVNFDGQIYHFDQSRGVDNGTTFASTGFQFGTFGHSGSRLEYFYFPTSARSIVKRMFQSTTVKVVDIEPGTPISTIGVLVFYDAKNLEEIFIPNDITVLISATGQGQFQNCTSLKKVEFEENSTLWDAGYNTFHGCTSLKKLYLPNSVITFGSEFARGSGLEEFSFGAGFEYFTMRNPGKDPDSNHMWVFWGSQKLKKVYMPASIAILSDEYKFDSYTASDDRLDTFDRIFNSAGSFTLIFTGTKDEIETLKTRFSYTDENQSINNALKNIYSYEEYVAAGCPSGSLAVYGYSACDAFYNGEHSVSEEYVFDSFITGSHTQNKCSDCSYNEKGEEYEPIISFLGVSLRMNGGSVTVGYMINYEALDAYLASGRTLNYGVVAYVPDGLDCKPVENGASGLKPVDEDYSIFAEIKNGYSSVDFIIKGLSTDEVSLAMCMFVYDGKSISYICGIEAGVAQQLESAYAITLNPTDGSVSKKL